MHHIWLGETACLVYVLFTLKKVCSRKIHSVDCTNNFKCTPKTRHVSAGFLNHNW